MEQVKHLRRLKWLDFVERSKKHPMVWRVEWRRNDYGFPYPVLLRFHMKHGWSVWDDLPPWPEKETDNRS